jgi:hypothetical protein
LQPKKPGILWGFHRNSLLTRTGNYFEGTGNSFDVTGNFQGGTGKFIWRARAKQMMLYIEAEYMTATGSLLNRPRPQSLLAGAVHISLGTTPIADLLAEVSNNQKRRGHSRGEHFAGVLES